MPARNRSLSRGLSVIQQLPPDLFVIYSTAAGDVALDGAAGKRNSPFAESFMRNMESNDDISIVIRNITRETLRLTDNKQRPYQEGSIISLDYYSLNPRKTSPNTPPVQQEDATVYYNRGEEFRKARDWDRAINEYTRAISINHNYWQAYQNRGYCYSLEGKKEYDQMLADYTAANRLNPNNAGIILTIGSYYGNTGDQERAIVEYNEAIRVNPNYALAYSSRGDAYRMLGNYENAITDCDRSIRINPENQWAFFTRGESYRMKGDNIKALNDFNEAIRLNPNFAIAYNQRAIIYRTQNRNDLAESDLATYNRLRAAGY
jgi:tetratricopeptide (TPR) repeat protein